MGQNVSPRAQNGLKKLVLAPQIVQDHFWKNTFLSPFRPIFGVEMAHFQGILVFSLAQNAPPRAQNGQKYVFEHPRWSRNKFEKNHFFSPGDPSGPTVGPAVRGPGCPPAVPSDHWYGCLGVCLGDSEGWKPRKVGGCGWTRCPRNRILSHVAQDTARAWLRGAGAHCAHFGAFWRLFKPFLGHIVGRVSDISWAVSRTYRALEGH